MCESSKMLFFFFLLLSGSENLGKYLWANWPIKLEDFELDQWNSFILFYKYNLVHRSNCFLCLFFSVFLLFIISFWGYVSWVILFSFFYLYFISFKGYGRDSWYLINAEFSLNCVQLCSGTNLNGQLFSVKIISL